MPSLMVTMEIIIEQTDKLFRESKLQRKKKKAGGEEGQKERRIKLQEGVR